MRDFYHHSINEKGAIEMDYQAWGILVFTLFLAALWNYMLRNRAQIGLKISRYKDSFGLYLQLQDFQRQVEIQETNNNEETVAMLQKSLARVGKDIPPAIYTTLDQLLDKYDEALLVKDLEKSNHYFCARLNDPNSSEMLHCSQELGRALQALRDYLMSGLEPGSDRHLSVGIV